MSVREISFTVIGDPVPFARAGSNGKQRFTPREQRAHMLLIGLLAKQAMGHHPPLFGQLELCVEAIYEPPASWSAKRRAAAGYKVSKPDLSNIEKLVEDALNGIAFNDDAQIVRRGPRCCKRYGERAETRVTVRMVEGAP